MYRPNPAEPPTHSPIVAPTTLYVTATRRPEKKEGSADGKRTMRQI
ncbi:MAG: hypothetical protein P8Z41_12455 [Anaerolineales bacterium]